MYNSCGDRHCPQCGGAKRSDWVASTSQLLLEGVPYFQVVFTIPSELSSLALGNRREMYDLLFRSAWKSLQRTIADEHGFEAAAVMVLHTWNQKLEAHAHVHAVVPGGGPSLEGGARWVKSKGDRSKNRKRRGAYLVDADVLRRRFRTEFLAGLLRLHTAGKLSLRGPNWNHLQSMSAFEAFLAPLESIDWVTYIEPPPTDDCSPERVVKYLGRYLTGGPISDRRLISHDAGHVRFLAREGKAKGGERRQVPVRISNTEFVRRWSLHILPKGYTKTRRFGGFSNTHRKRYLAECRDLIKPFTTESTRQPGAATDSIASEELTDQASHPKCLNCPNCEMPMVCLSTTRRLGWRDVMSDIHRPHWYTDR